MVWIANCHAQPIPKPHMTTNEATNSAWDQACFCGLVVVIIRWPILNLLALLYSFLKIQINLSLLGIYWNLSTFYSWKNYCERTKLRTSAKRSFRMNAFIENTSEFNTSQRENISSLKMRELEMVPQTIVRLYHLYVLSANLQ